MGSTEHENEEVRFLDSFFHFMHLLCVTKKGVFATVVTRLTNCIIHFWLQDGDWKENKQNLFLNTFCVLYENGQVTNHDIRKSKKETYRSSAGRSELATDSRGMFFVFVVGRAEESGELIYRSRPLALSKKRTRMWSHTICQMLKGRCRWD